MELSKDLVGTFIYGKTTGNASRGGAHVVKFKVVKVKRKYFDLVQYFEVDGDSTYNRVSTFCPESGALESEIRNGYGGNSGYDFFGTQLEAEQDIEKDKFLVEVHQNMHNLKDLPYEYVKAFRNMLVREGGYD